MKNSLKSQLVCFLYMLIAVVGMVMAADYFKQNEIIFPEAAAIATGLYVAPKIPWKVDYIRLLVSVSLCALIGWGIVLLIPTHLGIQMIIGFVLAHIVLLFSGTTMTPMISATVLPILVQSKSWVYPASAVTIVVVMILFRLILEKSNLKQKENFEKIGLPKSRDYILMLVRIVVASAAILAAIYFDMRFCVAPPLLVAFVELSKAESKAIEKPMQVIFLITGCALFGAAIRYIVTIRGNAAIYIAALATVCLAVMLMNMYKMYFPPAAAMGILAMLIPEEMVPIYPLQVFIGISILVIIALVIHVRLQKGVSDNGKE